MGFIHRSYIHDTGLNLYLGSVDYKGRGSGVAYPAPVTGGAQPVGIPPYPVDIRPLEFAAPVLFKIPCGSQNVRIKITQSCSIHPACITTIHYHNGHLLTGAPLSIAPLLTCPVEGYGPLVQLSQICPDELIQFDPLLYSCFYDYACAHVLFGFPSLFWCRYDVGGKEADWASRPFSANSSSYSLLDAYECIYSSDPFSFGSALNSIFPSHDTLEYINWHNRPATDIPPEYDKRQIATLSKLYRDLFPTIFPSDFVFDDSLVNGDCTYFVSSSSGLHTFEVEYETIRWSGNPRSGTATLAESDIRWGDSAVSDSSRNWTNTSTSNPYEVLEIDEVQCTMIVMISYLDYIRYTAEWDECDDEEEREEPCPAGYSSDAEPEPEPRVYLCSNLRFKRLRPADAES